MKSLRFLKNLILVFVLDLFFFPILLVLSIVGRFYKKLSFNQTVDTGLGPDPLINNVYHKKALTLKGYTAETFVNGVYFITSEFDVRGDLIFRRPVRFLNNYYLFLRSIFKYKAIYLYFNGGPLGSTRLLWKIEPLLYKLAGVKTVIMAYGGDVQDMSRSPNLLFKHTQSKDYPEHRKSRQRIAQKIDLWTHHASHVISGCEWVDYMYHWDTLMLAHFSIDTDRWQPIQINQEKSKTFKILHAPNHRNIKGTQYFIRAVEELKAEGLDLELILIEKVPNTEIQKIMASVDIVADQLIIGWYAMFALEALSMEKPVLCYLRPDLEELYIAAGLIKPNEIPIINCTPLTVKDTIRDLVLNPERLTSVKRASREYVLKHHSLEVVGDTFKKINESLGIQPSMLNNIREKPE